MRASSQAPSRSAPHPADDEMVTTERRVRRSEAPLTRRMPRVDPQLLALARGDVPTLAPPEPPPDAYVEPDPATVRYPGELPPITLAAPAVSHLELAFDEPEDPFGGLLPVEDVPVDDAPEDPFGGLLPVDDEPEETLDDDDILEVVEDSELRDLELAVVDARKPR